MQIKSNGRRKTRFPETGRRGRKRSEAPVPPTERRFEGGTHSQIEARCGRVPGARRQSRTPGKGQTAETPIEASVGRWAREKYFRDSRKSARAFGGAIDRDDVRFLGVCLREGGRNRHRGFRPRGRSSDRALGRNPPETRPFGLRKEKKLHRYAMQLLFFHLSETHP